MKQNNPDSALRAGPRGRGSRTGWVRRLLGDALFVVRRDRKWWVVPLLIVLLLLSTLFFIAAIAGPLAPFIYPLM